MVFGNCGNAIAARCSSDHKEKFGGEPLPWGAACGYGVSSWPMGLTSFYQFIVILLLYHFSFHDFSTREETFCMNQEMDTSNNSPSIRIPQITMRRMNGTCKTEEVPPESLSTLIAEA